MLEPVGSPTSAVMIVPDFPSKEDFQTGHFFSCWRAKEFRRMLREAGFSEGENFVFPALQERPFGGDIEQFIPEKRKNIKLDFTFVYGKSVHRAVNEGIARLEQQITQNKPRVIIAIGVAALFALTGETQVRFYRGSVLRHHSGAVIIPTYSPETCVQQWKLRAVAIQDLRRAKRALSGEGITPPEKRFITRPMFDETMRTLWMLQEKLDQGPLKLSIDIETKSNHIMCIAFAWTKHDAICIPFVETERGGASYWILEDEAKLVHTIYQILRHPNIRTVWQNGLFDAQYLYRSWHIVVKNYADTMLMQHSCFSTSQKSLDFLASIYCDYFTQWKGIARQLGQKSDKTDD